MRVVWVRDPSTPKTPNWTDRHLFQERLHQHPDMAALHPASVNSVRLITFHDNDVELFSAAQRIGARNMQVDNWAAGGLVGRINTQTGQLEGDAYFKPGHGTRTPTHPDTGIAFHGYRIPYFHEAVTLVKQAHRHIPDIYSVGWDVAITPKGR
jgi:Sugar-transfer associated ATP-grasp